MVPPTLPMPAHQSYKHHRPAGTTSVLGVFSCRVSRNPYIAGGELLHELRSHPGNERVEVRAFLVAGSSTCCTAGDIEQSLHSQLMCVCPSTSCPPMCEEFEPGAGRQTGGRTGVCVCACVRACR